MTVITKALEQVYMASQRAFWEPRTALVTGAGPIGLLAALRLKANNLEVHVLDRAETGPKPDLVSVMGGTYHSGRVTDLDFEPDVIVECTGVGSVIADSIQKIGAGGIICLTGIGAGGAATGAVARCRRASRAEEQSDCRQRQRQQAALVQSWAKTWPVQTGSG
jgi:glucose 1-dehydrogenase